MKDSFPTMRLWTAFLLTLGAVLIQCPAQAQISTHETDDEGKTWHSPGTGRSNRGTTGSGRDSTPSVSPEEAARQARQQAEADAGYKANEEGGKYWDQGNWDAAIQAYEKAIQNYEEALRWGDSEILRKNLANNRKNLANAKGYKASLEGLKYQKQGNLDAAIQAYEKSLQWYDDKIVRGNLAIAKGAKANREGAEYGKQDNWDAAVQAFEKALQNYEEALRWDDSEIARKDLAIVRKNLADAKGWKANLEGAEYWKQGNWDAAVQAYEKALQWDDDKATRNNLTYAKEQARLQRERVQQEQARSHQEQERSRHDAEVTAGIQQGVDRLVTALGNQSATGNLDSPTTGTPLSGGGLDFITDPAAVLSKPAVSNTSEPNTEARPQLYSIKQHSEGLKLLSGKGSSDGQATTASELAREGFDKSTTRGPVDEQAERAVQNLAQRDRTNPDGDPIVPQQIRNQNPKIAEAERQRDGLKQERQAVRDQIGKIEQDLKTTTDDKAHGKLLMKRTEALQNETNLTNQIYTINFNIAAEIPKPSEVPAKKENTPNPKTRPTKN